MTHQFFHESLQLWHQWLALGIGFQVLRGKENLTISQHNITFVNNSSNTCYLKLADSSIDRSIQSSIEFHCEGVGGVGVVSSNATDDCAQLLNVVQHHFHAILYWVLHNLKNSRSTYTYLLSSNALMKWLLGIYRVHDVREHWYPTTDDSLGLNVSLLHRSIESPDGEVPPYYIHTIHQHIILTHSVSMTSNHRRIPGNL